MSAHFHPTESIEYIVKDTVHGIMIVRGDGSYTIVRDSQNPDDIAEGLINGDVDDSEFIWFED